MIPGHLPRRMPRVPQNPSWAFFYFKMAAAIFEKKTGVFPISSLWQLEKIFSCLFLCFKAQRVHPDDQK